MSKGLIASLISGVAGAGAGLAGVMTAVGSVSSSAPAAFVPYAATQVAASTLGVSSMLGGAAATSSAVSAIGGPAVIAGAAVCLPAVALGGIGLIGYKIFSK